MSWNDSERRRRKERVERSVDELNRGNPNLLLEHYAEDVVVLVPLYRPGNPIGEPRMEGKSAFQDLLLRSLASHRSYRVRAVEPEPTGMLVSLECEHGDRMTIRVEEDETGLGRRVHIFVT